MLVMDMGVRLRIIGLANLALAPMPMRRFTGTALAVLIALVAGLALAGTASASPVLVLDAHGHSAKVDDPFLGPDPMPPAAAGRPARTPATSVSGGAAEVHRALRSRAYSGAARVSLTSALAAARSTMNSLSGTRRAELRAVMIDIETIAARGWLTPSRLPAAVLTLQRNREWWGHGNLLSSGQRVEFAGSELVWEYYPGQGLQLQELGSFGKANGLYTAGRKSYPRMVHLVDELIPLASQRAGGLSWEVAILWQCRDGEPFLRCLFREDGDPGLEVRRRDVRNQSPLE